MIVGYVLRTTDGQFGIIDNGHFLKSPDITHGTSVFSREEAEKIISYWDKHPIIDFIGMKIYALKMIPIPES